MWPSGSQEPSACCWLSSHCRVRSIKLRIDVMDPGHVLELHQPVGGQGAIRRGMAEPVETAAGHLEAQQPLVAEVDILAGLGLDGGQILLVLPQVVQGQHVGIRRRGRLLEAAVGPLEDRVEPFDQLAETRRIDFDDRLDAPLDGLRRYLQATSAGSCKVPLPTCSTGWPSGTTSIGRLTASATSAAAGRDLELVMARPSRRGCGNATL